jgi:hypothetical protein
MSCRCLETGRLMFTPIEQQPGTNQQVTAATSTTGSPASETKQGSSKSAGQQRSVLGAVKQVAETSVVLGALLYGAGWSYLYGYFRAFGLSLGQFDFSTENYLVFALPVVFKWKVLTVIVAGYILLLIVVFVTKKVVGADLQRFSTVTLVVLLLLLGKLLSQQGILYGEEDASHNMGPNSSLAMVSVTLKSTEIQGNPCTEIEDGEFRLLAHGKKFAYFVLPADSDARHPDVAQVTLCSVPEDSIELIEMQTPLLRETR